MKKNLLKKQKFALNQQDNLFLWFVKAYQGLSGKWIL